MIALDKVKDFSVLLVGDAIMDEYLYVKTIGKAIKENALSALLGKREVFRGGVWAAAQHTLGFCSHVDVSTGPMVMWNTRMVDDVYLRKLFVVHDMRENDMAVQGSACPHCVGGDPRGICKYVGDNFKPAPCRGRDVRDYDLVIVTDFGHGAMTKELIARVTKEARFLAVNAQTNSTNFGFNLITKYPRADYVVIDEMEARLAAHDRDSPIEDVILKLGFKKIIVTMGTQGAVGFDGAFERQKALTNKVIDTMGAGDAFLSVSAPFAAAGASMLDLIRIGNAAGAVKVGIVGHRKSVDREMLETALYGD